MQTGMINAAKLNVAVIDNMNVITRRKGVFLGKKVVSVSQLETHAVEETTNVVKVNVHKAVVVKKQVHVSQIKIVVDRRFVTDRRDVLKKLNHHARRPLRVAGKLKNVAKLFNAQADQVNAKR